MPDHRTSGIDSLRAWRVCFAAFVEAFVIFGVSYSFGVFLKPMALTFGAGHALMSTLFATLTVLSFFLSPVTGDLADRYGPKLMVASGAVLLAAGLILSAHVYSFPLLFLTYGVGVGDGVACIYLPSVAAVGEWFKVYRDIALGIAVSRIGLGTLVAAPVAAILIDKYDWRTCLEIYGWASIALLLPCAALLAQPPQAPGKSQIGIRQKVATRRFGLLYLGRMLAGIAIYISYVYLPAFAEDIGASHVAAASLVGYIGASSIVGRIGMNAVAPRFGQIATYRMTFVMLLVSFAFWLTAHSYVRLAIFSVIMGVGYGGLVALTPAVAVALFGTAGLGELLGVLYTVLGVACLIGPPLAGVIVDRTNDYRGPVAVATLAALAALIVVMRRPTASPQQDSASALKESA